MIVAPFNLVNVYHLPDYFEHYLRRQSVKKIMKLIRIKKFK